MIRRALSETWSNYRLSWNGEKDTQGLDVSGKILWENGWKGRLCVNLEEHLWDRELSMQQNPSSFYEHIVLIQEFYMQGSDVHVQSLELGSCSSGCCLIVKSQECVSSSWRCMWIMVMVDRDEGYKSANISRVQSYPRVSPAQGPCAGPEVL